MQNTLELDRDIFLNLYCSTFENAIVVKVVVVKVYDTKIHFLFQI